MSSHLKTTVSANRSGFTLIELLVVIAIIGILASVILASLNTARDKGSDAVNKSNINNIRAHAALVYDNNGDYDAVCMDPNVLQAIAAAGSGAACDDHADGWAASVLLLDPETPTWHCVDSTGTAVEQGSAHSAGTVAVPPSCS